MIQSLLWIIFLTATISSAAPTGNTQVLKKNAPRAQLTAKLDSSVTPKSVVMKFAVQSSRYKLTTGHFDIRSYRNEGFNYSRVSRSATAAVPLNMNPPGADGDLMVDTFSVGDAAQKLSFIFDLSGHNVIVNPSTSTPTGFDMTKSPSGGFDANGRTVSSFIDTSNDISLFGSSDLSLATTIQGRLRRENFFFGYPPVAQSAKQVLLVLAAPFIIVASNVDGIFGAAPRVGNYLRLPNVIETDIALNYFPTACFSLAFNLYQSSNSFAEVLAGGIDSSQYIGALEYFPVFNHPASYWWLKGGQMQVNGVSTGFSMGVVIFDTMSSFIHLPPAFVLQLYRLIPGYAIQRIAGQPDLYLLPCQNLPTISFSFISSVTYPGKTPTFFTLWGVNMIHSISTVTSSVPMCVGAVQASTISARPSLGIPFLTSLYTVYTYDKFGAASQIGMAQKRFT